MAKDYHPRSDFLPFAKPDLTDRESELVQEVLRSGWLTTGAMTQRLESDFASRVGATHAVAVNSCTAALHLALEAIGLQAGDEVITSPYTFASTAEVIRYFGARPRFVDVDPKTLNIDPAKIGAALSARTRAIIPVHIGGHPADLDPIDDLARANGIALIEDAAHSLPAEYKGKMIGEPRLGLGSTPHLICFSFYATKTMTTGEGGMICTHDGSLAQRCRLMSLHGITANAWNRYAAEGSWYYEIITPGYKYNLTDIAAAIGVAQLERLDQMRERRAQIAQRYSEAFTVMTEVETPSVEDWASHAWHLYSLRLNLATLTIERARFVEELKSRNIGTSVHFIPLHLHPYYRDTYGFEPDDFPVARREFLREVSLPIYSSMSDGDASDVIEAVADILRLSRR